MKQVKGVKTKSSFPIDLTLDISKTNNGDNILAQITPHLLEKTNKQNKKGDPNYVAPE